jgi:hypothetical protein
MCDGRKFLRSDQRTMTMSIWRSISRGNADAASVGHRPMRGKRHSGFRLDIILLG